MVGLSQWRSEVQAAADRAKSAPPLDPFPTPEPGLSTVFHGDSITQADTDTFDSFPGQGSWVGHALSYKDIPWEYRATTAVAGQTTTEIRARFAADVLSRKPQAVVLLAGTNDIGQGVTTAETIANLRAMIEAAQRRDLEVWLISPPPRADYAAQVSALIAAEEALAKELGVPLIDGHTALAAPQGGYKRGLSSDGIHPNREGAEVLGEAVATQVVKGDR
ncbi:GDSL-type esterase/lipase family protein [Nocardioides sp. zg-DK7169]|uniref:SGNH/GDSL hydrolase family protein n=1 Tax=Nocardioides sp. zg-DK7169 TaxID=2736600 RepID=UPI001551B2C5|nr:GDSL-type esterase/lipase family protein [Nocardioides sp. zg-DK7169]NPC97254.1 hypothetical protein [Nocardioides sp. zg-DK7169]